MARWIALTVVMGASSCLPCKTTCDGDSCKQTGSCSEDSTPTARVCTPHDPDKHKADSSGAYTFATLPMGACQDAAACSMTVYGPCFGDPEYVGHPYNVYTCSCSAGAWSCALSSPGASICTPDAGSDGVFSASVERN